MHNEDNMWASRKIVVVEAIVGSILFELRVSRWFEMELNHRE